VYQLDRSRFVFISLFTGALFACITQVVADEGSFVPPGETEPEPYLLEQPGTVVRGRKHPLIVFLHGRGGTHRRQWLTPALDTFRKQAAARGYFVLVPHLGTDSWMNARARRVLNALLDRTLKSHPIDRERVFVMGMSMGGGGALTFAVHHGARVCAVCDIFGVTDFTQFYNAGRYHESLSKAFGGTPESVPEVYQAQSAVTRIDAFAKVPVFVLHGDSDTVVPTEHSRQFVKAMMVPGYDVLYREVPGGTHTSGLIRGHEDEILGFFDAVGGSDYDPRLAFLATRTNLAQGKPYQFSAEPRYRLTADDGDLTDLTDGALSARRDERVWFERQCVAWHGDHGVNLVVDLGAVQGIGEITGRFLGGREQGGLRFPQQVGVAVSADGETYRRVGLYRKTMDDADFGVPAEEGRAWMHALRFRDLRTRGRYVAFMVQFDGSFCASDELFVLAADHFVAQDKPGSPVSRPVVFPFGPDRYTAYPLKGQWFAGPVESWSCIGGRNTLPDKRALVTLILDLPPEVVLTKTMINERYGGRPVPAPEPKEIVEGDSRYLRYEIEARGLSEKFWMYLFWRTDQPADWSAPARLGSRWESGEQPMVALEFRAVDMPAAPRPKQTHVSLDWMSQSFWTRNRDTVLDLLAHCGFTAMPYFKRQAGKLGEDLKDALRAADAKGFEIVYNFSPIHALQAQKKKHPELLCQLPTGKPGHLCPSYRGPLLDEHLDLIAEGFAFHPGHWVFLDCEVHWSSVAQIGECTRCCAQRKDGESDTALAARLGTEIYGMLRDRLEAVRRAQGGPEFRMGSYAIHPSATRYPVLPFDSLYPDTLDFAMPSIYTVDPAAVQTRIEADRSTMARSDNIPWLQPGNMGEKPAEAQFREALSCLLAGGMGVTYYTHHGFDAADLAAVARAILTVNTHEPVFTQGIPIADWDDMAEGFSTCGRMLKGRAVWIVASDRAEPTDIVLPSPQGLRGVVSELRVEFDKAIEKHVTKGPMPFAAGQTRVFTALR
jgi:acetyl esterase/lipase